jgi:very-short-patch-repair endonuclease
MENTEAELSFEKNYHYGILPLAQRFTIIRQAYDYYMPFIMERRIDPYFLEWDWTPIEYNLWCDIRRIGIPFYPQVPALTYFLDFADPVKKIAIEADGKRWHSDKIRDQIRDKKLREAGWQVFRVDGSMTYRNKEQYFKYYSPDHNRRYNAAKKCFETESADLYESFFTQSGEGLIERLKEEYYFLPTVITGYRSEFTDTYFNSFH